MVQIEQLSKIFNVGKPDEVRAVQEISLQLMPGEFTILVGTNGSGKSTLINLITGSLKTDTGKIYIDEDEVSAIPEYKRSRLIARIFQDPLQGTAPDLTILDNFRLASLRSKPKLLRIGNSQAFRSRVQEQVALLKLGLENKLDQLMGTLSGGQRQALTLSMAVMDEARLILMDEPNAALDPRTSELILDTARSIIREHNLCSIMVTHNLRDAANYADHLIHMKDGMIRHDVSGGESRRISVAQLYEWMN